MENSFFNKCCWEKWLSACRKLNVDPCLSPCTTINSKWTTDLNIRPETLKLVQERAGNTLEATCIGKEFLSRTPAAQEMQIKTTLRLHLTPVKIAIIKNTTNNKCWQGCREKGTLIHCWWECKLVQPLWKTIWRLPKN
jgi:hypothetical protein